MTTLVAPVHKQLIDRLKTALNAVGAEFFDGKVPDGADIPMLSTGINGIVRPHVCLWMDDDDEFPGSRSLGGARSAMGLLPFVLLLVSYDNLTLSDLRDICKKELVGFVVEDGGEIMSVGGVTGQPVATQSNPQRYMRTIEFVVPIGASGDNG